MSGSAFLSVNDELLYQDQAASGTTGPSYSFGAWRTVPLDTEVTDTAGIGTLAANQVTLAAGSYEMIATVAHGGNAAANAKVRARLYNATDAAAIVQGTQVDGVIDTGDVLTVIGSFVLAAAKAVELQIFSDQNLAAPAAASTGEVEVYASLKLRRYAR